MGTIDLPEPQGDGVARLRADSASAPFDNISIDTVQPDV